MLGKFHRRLTANVESLQWGGGGMRDRRGQLWRAEYRHLGAEWIQMFPGRGMSVRPGISVSIVKVKSVLEMPKNTGDLLDKPNFHQRPR